MTCLDPSVHFCFIGLFVHVDLQEFVTSIFTSIISNVNVSKLCFSEQISLILYNRIQCTLGLIALA